MRQIEPKNVRVRKISFKSLTVNKNSSKIIVKHSNSEYSEGISRQMESIAILLGAYNEFGRNTDLTKHIQRTKKFWSLVEEIEKDLL